MANLQTCKENLKILDLSYPFSVQEERKAFHNLARKYNPDLCETSECREENKAKLVEIMEAHLYLKNAETLKACCHIVWPEATQLNELFRQIYPNSDGDYCTADIKMKGALKEQLKFIEYFHNS